MNLVVKEIYETICSTAEDMGKAKPGKSLKVKKLYWPQNWSS